jgi:hypothetical protein
MSTDSHAVDGKAAGHIEAMYGRMMRLDRDRVESQPAVGDAVFVGDVLSLDPDAVLHLVFHDGMRIVTLGGALIIENYVFARDEDDTATFAIDNGTFALAGGRIASGIDTLSVHAGAMSLSVRAARLIAKTGLGKDDMVTLLPKPFGGPGSVLVHNKVGVETLEMPFQTVRLSGAEGYLTQPMTLPQGVIADMYPGPELAAWLVPVEETPFPDEGIAGDSFAPFDVLADHMFERRFTEQSVFPREQLEGLGTARGRQNSLFEDAFDGQRFRLKDDEPKL